MAAAPTIDRGMFMPKIPRGENRGYSTKDRPLPRRAPSTRLRKEIETSLVDFLTSEETEAGVRTRYLVDLALVSGARDAQALHLFDAEHWCEAAFCAESSIYKMRRARRAFLDLREHLSGGRDHAGVLGAVYGPRDGSAKELAPLFGTELAPLAKYTNEVERRRGLLVERAVLRRFSEGEIDVRPSVVEGYFDRVITSGDALRHALAPFAYAPFAPDEAAKAERKGLLLRYRAARKLAEELFVETREAFVVIVREEADRMLSRACSAFREAWLGARA